MSDLFLQIGHDRLFVRGLVEEGQILDAANKFHVRELDRSTTYNFNKRDIVYFARAIAAAAVKADRAKRNTTNV
jgi:phosphoketolase